MRRSWIIGLLVLLAACQPGETPQALPTVAVLPSLTPPDLPATEVLATDMPAPTVTDLPAATLVPLNTAESLPPTPLPASPTSEATVPVINTALAVTSPQFSTLTPVPPGVNAPARTTPQVMADTVITEQQFQREVDLAVENVASIQQALIDFTPQGIQVQLTALGGQAYITGNVLVTIDVADGFIAISLGDVTVNAAEPPEAFLAVTATEFYPLFINALDTLIEQRVGTEHDLENLLLNDVALEVFLLVPEP
jgi:hypothetical protein